MGLEQSWIAFLVCGTASGTDVWNRRLREQRRRRATRPPRSLL